MGADEPQEEIDETVRYSGTVFKFLKRRGFGRIIPEGKTEEEKDDMVFVHWKQIQSIDEWPSLSDGQKVEYYLGKKLNAKNPKKEKFAAKVTLVGGEPVNHGDTRNFPDRNQRFVGIVEFFDPKKGFGFIKPKEDFAFEETDFLASKKGNIYVAREDIKLGAGIDVSPSLKDKTEIEFALYKREDGDKGAKWAAGDVTRVGGDALGTDDFKPRRKYDPNAKRLGKRKRNQKGKGNKGKKGGKFNKGFQMGGKTFIPMNMMQQMGGMQMAGFGGMNMMGGQKKKRRRKNKN